MPCWLQRLLMGYIDGRNVRTKSGTIDGRSVRTKSGTIDGRNVRTKSGTIAGRNVRTKSGTIAGRNVRTKSGTIYRLYKPCWLRQVGCPALSGSLRLQDGEIVAREREPGVMRILRRGVAATRDVHLCQTAATMDCFEVIPKTLLTVILTKTGRALGNAASQQAGDVSLLVLGGHVTGNTLLGRELNTAQHAHPLFTDILGLCMLRVLAHWDFTISFLGQLTP